MRAPRVLVAVGLILALQACGGSGSGASAGLDGNFEGTLTLQGVDASNCLTGTLLMSLTQSGTSLSGTWSSFGFNGYGLCPYLNSSGSVTGTVSGSSVVIYALNGTSHGYTVVGTLSGSTITGTYTESLYNSDTNTITLQKL